MNGLLGRAAGVFSQRLAPSLAQAKPWPLGWVLQRLACRRSLNTLVHGPQSVSLASARMRWAPAASAAASSGALPLPLAGGARQRRQLAAASTALGSPIEQQQRWQDAGSPARLHSLRLAPPPLLPLQRGPKLPPRRHALSPAWQPEPGNDPFQQQQQQQRGYTSQAPWWQFWGRHASSSTSTSSGSSSEDGSGDGGSGGELRPPAPLPAEAPSAAQERELKAVNTAVWVNGVIFVAKMFTWAATGSGSMLAEGLHSLADVANQVLLKHGVIRSRRQPTREHQYGFHKEKYVYALISAACVFCVGCGASVLHGVSSLLSPHALENMSYSLAVLLGSSILEAYSLHMAYSMIRQSAEEQGMGVWQYIRRGRDPTTVAILWEDGGAVAGLGLAGGFTLLTWLTGHQFWDALGSIAVGLLMGVIALQLMRTNKRFLIGQAMEPSVERSIVEHLQNDNMVVRVIDPKSEEMGDGVFRFKAEIQWSGEHVVQKYLAGLGRDSVYRQIRAAACTVPPPQQDDRVMQDAIDMAMMEFGKGVIRTVGSEIDRLEGELKYLVPGLVYVDLETDKGGGGMAGSLMGSTDWGDVDLEAVRRLYDNTSSAQQQVAAAAGGGAQDVPPSSSSSSSSSSLPPPPAAAA